MTCTMHVAWDERLTQYDFGPGHPMAQFLPDHRAAVSPERSHAK